MKIIKAFQSFFKTEASGGLLLLGCALLALIWANSPWQESYFQTWNTPLTIGLGSFSLSKPLILWINDGLMAIFFFLVGLEIKREVIGGELSQPKQALLPIVGAIGGMLLPALIFMVINANSVAAQGWGIPMATDIAFALGILALMGDRVPTSLKILLTAIAIIDDLGAVLVIALFYTAEISWISLGIGGLFLLALILSNRLNIQRPAVYVLLGIGLWFAFLKSGVHATIAGVLLAFTIPVQRRMQMESFLKTGKNLLDEFAKEVKNNDSSLPSETQKDVIHAMEVSTQKATSLLVRMEHALHGWVAFVIVPIFALANAGVSLGGNFSEAIFNPLTLGIIFGLIVGKQLGVAGFIWLAVKTKLAVLPENITWNKIYGIATLCGIGFTMSLFITSLAFNDATLIDLSKLGILLASLLSAIWGWIVLKR